MTTKKFCLEKARLVLIGYTRVSVVEGDEGLPKSNAMILRYWFLVTALLVVGFLGRKPVV
jgi:hypothetical protein